jgi:Ni/Co efflux regulator RcnB
MNRTLIGLAAAALLGVSGLAAAHDGRDFDRGQDRSYNQVRSQSAGNYGDHGYGRNESRGYDYGRAQQGWRDDRGDRYVRPPAYAVRVWRRGDWLPSAYRSRSYVVDYPRYPLYAPPRGSQWVRVDNDVVLTALATGLVLDVIYNLGR